MAQCQQWLLDSLKSGEYALCSADKEGRRRLCCYRGAWLRAAVGEDGRSLLRLPGDEELLHYIQQLSGPVLDLVDGQPQWRYELTAAEQLAQWQQQVARLHPFDDRQRQFVT